MRRNGASSVTSPGAAIWLAADRELADQIGREGGPRREQLVEAGGDQEHVGVDARARGTGSRCWRGARSRPAGRR